MNINLELYKIFISVAESGSITKASNNLNISQPAITKHIKNLEDSLGTPLFIRTKKGVKLNEYGEKIYLKVKEALFILNEVNKDINEYNNNYNGIIKIGISTTLARKYLLKYLEEFHKSYPNISLKIYTDPTKDLIKKLKNGLIDIIISKFPEHKDLELNYKKLGSTNYIFVVNKSYKELINKKLNIKDIIKYPILLQEYPSNSRYNIDNYLKDNKIYIEPTMSIASSSLLIDFVSIGYGVGYVTKLYIEKELKNKELYELSITPTTNNIDYGIITLRKNRLPNYVKIFINYICNKNYIK